MVNESDGSPSFVIDLDRMRANATRFSDVAAAVFPTLTRKVFFALKAHPAPQVVSALNSIAYGFEVFTTAQISWVTCVRAPYIASGFIKSSPFLQLAIRSAEYTVIENHFELQHIHVLARHLNLQPRIVLRIALTEEAKVGLSLSSLQEHAKRDLHLDVVGVHFHPGWNVKDDAILRLGLERLRVGQQILREAGWEPSIMNFGGSFCETAEDPDQLLRRMSLYRSFVDDPTDEVHFEPGRYIAGDAGLLTCTVVSVNDSKRILFIDTCAYGYRFTGATPRAKLAELRDEHTTEWTLYGFWPTESDVLEHVILRGSPRPGDSLILCNLGAYCLGLLQQFAVEQPMSLIYTHGCCA